METLNLTGQKTKIKLPCNEQSILWLQNAFTTPGIHEISVKNVKEGRTLVYQILNSLKWYQDVACLSLLSTETDQVADILEKIEQPITHERVLQFFMDNFYYDFLWIEATSELLKKPWINTFEQQLNQYHIDHMIPIIVISY